MKIAIVTIIDMINYGNRLQNYAVQHILQFKGYEVETFNAISFKRFGMNYTKKLCKMFFPHTFAKKRTYWSREVIFQRFTNKYIKQRNLLSVNGTIHQKVASEYDYFVVGSDQVWNPEFIRLDIPNRGIENRFLEFAKPEQRIALASSFGVDKIPAEYKSGYTEGLKGFKAVSCREEAGADIVECLVGGRPPVLIDPTLMLSRNEWDEIIEEVPGLDIGKPYILKYVLGMQSDKYKAKIERLAEKKGMQVIELLKEGNDTLFNASPGMFVWLIKNAALVCTDSFHATVFSFIYDVPYLLHKREDTLQSMNSRINTLLQKLSLPEITDENIPENILICNYKDAKNKLDAEKKCFDEYLDRVFL